MTLYDDIVVEKQTYAFHPSVVGSRMETSPTCLKIVGTVTHP